MTKNKDALEQTVFKCINLLSRITMARDKFKQEKPGMMYCKNNQQTEIKIDDVVVFETLVLEALEVIHEKLQTLA